MVEQGSSSYQQEIMQPPQKVLKVYGVESAVCGAAGECEAERSV